jgi:DNA-directed RNA polymerase specialized sigma24 family protein
MDVVYFNKWRRLALKESRAMARKLGAFELMEDMDSSAYMALWWLCSHEDRSKFTTGFVVTVVRRRAYDDIRSWFGHRNTAQAASRIDFSRRCGVLADDLGNDENVSDDKAVDPSDEAADADLIVWAKLRLKEKLDDRTLDALTAHLQGMTIAEAADKWDVTASRFSQIRTSARKRFKESFKQEIYA